MRTTRCGRVLSLILGRGCAWTLYTPRLPASDIYIKENRLERAGFGYVAVLNVGVTVTEVNGNVDHGSGQPIS
jgi:hypothetical protein